MFDVIDFREQIENYSAEDLEKVKKLADEALKERATQRYTFLMKQILTAFQQMQKEFPCAEILIGVSDDEEIDLLSYDLSEKNFYQ